MATMIPDKPINIPAGSREDEMFVALDGLSNEYYVFHSLLLITNAEGILRESETDFVIFHPQKGLICLEAKAGHVYCDEGIWYYGSGKRMKNGGPYRQADTNKWKLEKYFEEKGLHELWARCKTIHAVWFPSVSRNELNHISFPPEADRSITLTEESLSNIQTDIDRLFSIKLPGGIETDLSKAEVSRIFENVLCPSFNLVPSMVSEMGIKKKAFLRLLEEQKNILNFIDGQPFAVISGAAGTGKTMIAREKARLHAEDGEKVLFLCYNRFLCDFNKENHSHKNISYFTIDGFACSFCATQTADYPLLQEKLDLAYYENSFPFKHVIIDEGQDFGQDRIEETEIINTLETIALSEEHGGTFYLFYDKNQLIQGNRIPKYISESDCKLTLYRNCRNTENIATTSMRPLGVNGKPKMFAGCVKGESPKIYITGTAEKQKEYLDAYVRRLADKKIKDIVILTCGTEAQSFLYPYSTDGRYAIDGTSYIFTTCRKFKGLEAEAIILIDVSAETLIGMERLNFYVGASRAMFFLSIICYMTDEDCVEVLRQMQQSENAVKRPKKALAAALNALLTT